MVQSIYFSLFFCIDMNWGLLIVFRNLFHYYGSYLLYIIRNDYDFFPATTFFASIALDFFLRGKLASMEGM